MSHPGSSTVDVCIKALAIFALEDDFKPVGMTALLPGEADADEQTCHEHRPHRLRGHRVDSAPHEVADAALCGDAVGEDREVELGHRGASLNPWEPRTPTPRAPLPTRPRARARPVLHDDGRGLRLEAAPRVRVRGPRIAPVWSRCGLGVGRHHADRMAEPFGGFWTNRGIAAREALRAV